MDADQRNALLGLIEARHEIGVRYTRPRRIDATGGVGKFSLIFTVDDTRGTGEAVMKVMDPFCRDPYRIDSFRREEELLRLLRGQDGIIQSHDDLGTIDESLASPGGTTFPLPIEYYVMEKGRGSLKDEIDDGRYTLLDALGTFRAAYRAVQRIHTQQIAHRDIKPNNFIRFRHGILKLSDFGAARVVRSDAPSLLANYGGVWPGDYLYAAPEAAAGIHECDPVLACRSDVYSMGALLFELITGLQLGPLVLVPHGIADLALVRSTPASRRFALYLSCVDALVQGYPLPQLSDYADIPACVKTPLQELFTALAALDYRTRLVDPHRAFRQASICEKILRNEAAYQRWLLQRQNRRSGTLVRQ